MGDEGDCKQRLDRRFESGRVVALPSGRGCLRESYLLPCGYLICMPCADALLAARRRARFNSFVRSPPVVAVAAAAVLGLVGLAASPPTPPPSTSGKK